MDVKVCWNTGSFLHVSPTWLLNKMFSDFEGRFWLYLQMTFVSDYPVYKIKPATNDLHFPLAVITGFIGGEEGKTLLGRVANVIKKLNAKTSAFKFKIWAFYRIFFTKQLQNLFLHSWNYLKKLNLEFWKFSSFLVYTTLTDFYRKWYTQNLGHVTLQ